MDKTTKILCIVAALIAVLLCAASGVIGFRMGKKGIIVERDTVTSVITVRDTVTQYKPQYITKEVVRNELVYLKDTVRVHDSLYVSLPVEKKVYEDSNYRAVVTGIYPELESISVYPETKIITNTITVTEKQKPKKFGVGVQVGYGVTYCDRKIYPGPYVGVGISYNLIRF